MLAVVQRVAHAHVLADGRESGRIPRGLLALVGIHRDDADADALWIADRLLNLRVFPDPAGKMNLNAAQAGAALLVVPNFTLCATTGKGNRPGFDAAMHPDRARPLFIRLLELLTTPADPARTIPIAAGVFGADMAIHMHADGPVTLILDSSGRAR